MDPPVDSSINWKYQTANSFWVNEDTVKNWVDELGSGVRFVWLANCYSKGAFDCWDSDDDCVVYGSTQKSAWPISQAWDGTTYVYDDANDKELRIEGFKEHRSVEFIWTYILILTPGT